MNNLIKILNLKSLILNHEGGFTLLEALVAITIFSVMGVITVDLLSRTFQGGNKAQLISKIKQNGQSAMNTIDDDIRTANSVKCIEDFPKVSPDTGGTLVISKSGQYIRFRIYPNPNAQVSLGNGYITKEVLNPADFIDPGPCDSTTGSVRTYLTDTNKITGVSVKDGKFTWVLKDAKRDLVKVGFSLEAGVDALKSLDSQLDPVTFSTTIVLR